MTARRMRFHFSLVLGATLALAYSGSGAWAQGGESSPSGGAQKSGQEVLDEVPEGEALPDMPEQEVLLPAESGSGHKGTASSPGSNYIIGPEDVLDIDVFNVPELKKIVRVSNDGMIVPALIGRVKAAGLTADQLREVLEAAYGQTYLQDPHISVYVTEFRAQPASIIGAVERPGLYQLTGPRTLIEMLAMAGGLAKRSSGPAGQTLSVTRKEGFGGLTLSEGMELVTDEKLEINIRKLLYSHDHALNILIRPRDTISVTKADIVYVVGSVRKPGGFVLEDQEKVTVTQALALAEGLFGSPAKSSARIIRRTADGLKTEIPVDLKKVLAGKAEDIEMIADDILFVPDSAAKAALKRGAEAAIGTLSGILVYRR